MFLKSISPKNFGPFQETYIELERGVTVITGANDVGKSSLLRLLKIICSKSPNNDLTVADVSSERINELQCNWDEDPEITATTSWYHPRDTQDIATVLLRIAPKRWHESTVQMPKYSGNFQAKTSILPTAVLIDMGNGPTIRSEIPLAEMNQQERNLLNVGFGTGFQPASLAALSETIYLRTISNAEKKLNQRLIDILSPNLRFQFQLRSDSSQRKVLHLYLIDQHESVMELSQRGRGVQVFVSLLGRLAEQNYEGGQILLLLDEPETHLHADAQHAFRGALEKLAEGDRFQVVYATHSPSMVNTMRPRDIRLLKRNRVGDRASTVVDNVPFGNGFLSVRSSLGISPADSLLFAPITIVVEGKTEMVCLPIIFQRLELEGGDHEGLSQLLSQCIIIDAESCNNMGNLCRIARAHAGAVIAMADDDQTEKWKTQFAKESEGTPIVFVKKGCEFEQLIPRSHYFDALYKHCRDWGYGGLPFDENEFLIWEATQKHKKAFSKSVSNWIQEQFELREPIKSQVMKYAVQDTPLAHIDLISVKELVSKMRQSLASQRT